MICGGLRAHRVIRPKEKAYRLGKANSVREGGPGGKRSPIGLVAIAFRASKELKHSARIVRWESIGCHNKCKRPSLGVRSLEFSGQMGQCNPGAFTETRDMGVADGKNSRNGTPVFKGHLTATKNKAAPLGKSQKLLGPISWLIEIHTAS